MKVGCINSPTDFDVFQAAMGVLDETASAFEKKWGIDRLPRLVDPALAQRFYSQRRKLDDAIENKTAYAVHEEAMRMRNAWMALDKAATEANAMPLSPRCLETVTEDGTCIVIVPDEDAPQIDTAGRQCVLITLSSVGSLLSETLAHARLKAIGQHFPGAVVQSSRLPPPDWSRGDDLPF